MKKTMLKTLLFALITIIACTFTAYAAQPNIPEWTKNPNENPNDLMKKLTEEGYENVLGYPSPLINSLASDLMPGLRGVVAAILTEHGKLTSFLIYYFEAEEHAKKCFEDSISSLEDMRTIGLIKGGIDSSADTVSISDPAGKSAYYRLSGKVMTHGNVENIDTTLLFDVPKPTSPKSYNEQAVLSWLATPVQTAPPKAVLSKSDIDIFVKNHSELERAMNKYSDILEPIENVLGEAFGKLMMKGDNNAIKEAILKIRNFPVPDGLRSELSKFGLGDNAFEKIQVITFGGGAFTNAPINSAMPEYGSEEMEMALEEDIALHGVMMALGDLKAAIHENDIELLSSRIADLLPLLDN